MEYTRNLPLKLNLMGFIHQVTYGNRRTGKEIWQKGSIRTTVHHGEKSVTIDVYPEYDVNCKTIEQLKTLDQIINHS